MHGCYRYAPGSVYGRTGWCRRQAIRGKCALWRYKAARPQHGHSSFIARSQQLHSTVTALWLHWWQHGHSIVAALVAARTQHWWLHGHSTGGSTDTALVAARSHHGHSTVAALVAAPGGCKVARSIGSYTLPPSHSRTTCRTRLRTCKQRLSKGHQGSAGGVTQEVEGCHAGGRGVSRRR